VAISPAAAVLAAAWYSTSHRSALFRLLCAGRGVNRVEVTVTIETARANIRHPVRHDDGLELQIGFGGVTPFSEVAIPAPASALPGDHWVSAIERSGHNYAQVPFAVHTNWSQFHRRDMTRDA
jgi:hypothetical protein